MRTQDLHSERRPGDSGITEIQACQNRTVGPDGLLQQRVKGVGFGLALPAVGRLVPRRRHGHGGLRQSEGQRLPCEGVLLEKVAQVFGGVVQIEERRGGDLGEQRLQHGRVVGEDGLERAQQRAVDARRDCSFRRAAWRLIAVAVRQHGCPRRMGFPGRGGHI